MPLGEHGERVPVALYIGAVEGDPDDTLERQLESMGRYASSNGLEQARVYFDVWGSRIQFDRLVKQATWENPPFRCILVAGKSRFACSEQEYQDWTQWLEGQGVSVASISEDA